jgi:hypothetical protein
MKETTDHLDNIVLIIHACRKRNKQIGARLKHHYLNKEIIRVQLTGNGILHIPVLIAQNGISQLSKETIQKIADSFEVKSSK